MTNIIQFCKAYCPFIDLILSHELTLAIYPEPPAFGMKLRHWWPTHLPGSLPKFGFPQNYETSYSFSYTDYFIAVISGVFTKHYITLYHFVTELSWDLCVMKRVRTVTLQLTEHTFTTKCIYDGVVWSGSNFEISQFNMRARMYMFLLHGEEVNSFWFIIDSLSVCP